MSVNALYSGRPDRWSDYETHLKSAFSKAGLDVNLSPDLPPETVDYVIYAPNGPVQDFSPFPRLKAVLSLWAGVEKVIVNETLTVPLARMVDTGLTQGMQDWVTGHVLRHHLGMDYNILNQNGKWDPRLPPLATDRPVTILGLGALGQTCAKALAGLGFPVTGWSRSPKSVPGITCLSGAETLDKALSNAEILVLLLPFTAETENVINSDTLAQMPRGAVIINPGRGPLIDDDALLAALDSGQIGHATLDVFRTEPLPPEHPYWAHERVTVTPHIAAETRSSSAASVIAENIRRGQAGEPLLYQVDRKEGY